MPFVALIDESGEAGISKVRSDNQPGASPYFVLGAAVLQPAGIVHAKKRLAEFESSISKKKWRYATELDHASKVYFLREMAKLHARFFAVVSNKETLQEYRDLIENDPQKFYNKCLKYLLERICSYLLRFRATEDELSVVLEKRNHDYDRLMRFLSKVKKNPIYEESKALRLLNPFAIVTKAKEEEALLKLADLVSHSVYQCVNKSASNYQIPEYRYFEELSGRFAADAKGSVLGAGLKPIHSVESLELDDKVKRVFLSARAMPPRRAGLT